MLPITSRLEFPRTREFALDSVGDIVYYLSADGNKRIKFLPPPRPFYWRSKKVAHEVGLRLLLDYHELVE